MNNYFKDWRIRGSALTLKGIDPEGMVTVPSSITMTGDFLGNESRAAFKTVDAISALVIIPFASELINCLLISSIAKKEEIFINTQISLLVHISIRLLD